MQKIKRKQIDFGGTEAQYVNGKGDLCLITDILNENSNSITVKHGTTEYWNGLRNYIPASNEIVVYDDYYTKEVNGNTVYYPNIKIGSGNAYVQDLIFVGQYQAEQLLEHIRNNQIHVSQQDRSKWNGKLDFDNVSGETLIFTIR